MKYFGVEIPPAEFEAIIDDRGMVRRVSRRQRPLIRFGFKHIEAIKDQVIRALGICVSVNGISLKLWFEGNAPSLVPYCDVEGDNSKLAVQREVGRGWEAIDLCEKSSAELGNDPALVSYYLESRVSTSLSDHAEEDYAGEESGGYWYADKFVLRSGLVLTLAAQEAFELGLLKVLFNHKDKSPNDLVYASLDDFTKASPQYSERERDLWTCKSRTSAFLEFGINARPRTPLKKRLDEAWRSRNEIAHGKAVKISLEQFLETHYDVYRLMLHFAAEFEQKQMIRI